MARLDPHLKHEGSLSAIIRQIAQNVMVGTLKPRERLIEDDLMLRFNETRYNVRQALVHLESLGIVKLEPRRGATVRDFSEQDHKDIYDLRAVLQRHAAETLRLPPSKEYVRNLKLLARKHKQAWKRGDLEEFYKINSEFHVTLFSGCGNQLLVDAIEYYWWMSYWTPRPGAMNKNLQLRAMEEHAEMIAAIERSDRETLVKLCVDHMNLTLRLKDQVLAEP